MKAADKLGEMSHPPETPRHLQDLVLINDGGFWGGWLISPQSS